MVHFIDRRPTDFGSSLRQIIEQSKANSTRPHGVKVAGPGEGSVLIDESGQQWRWDGETVAAYDARMSAGEAAIAEAKQNLADAEAELGRAKARIDATETELQQKDALVAQARAEVAQAVEDLAATEARLSKTTQSVQQLQEAVSAADEAAAQAKARADSLAAQLESSFQSAPHLVRDSSFEDRNRWDTYAGATIGASDLARTGRGVLIAEPSNGPQWVYTAAADEDPSVSAGQTLRFTAWVRAETLPASVDEARFFARDQTNRTWVLSAYTPLQRLGVVAARTWCRISADWVVPDGVTAVRVGVGANLSTTRVLIDDFQVLDVTTQVELIEKLAAARREAQEASAAAQAASRAAGAAQDSANGKTTIVYTRTTGKPGAGGVVPGDTVFVTGAGGGVIQLWRWDGSDWVESKLEDRLIANLDAGKITAGTLDSARIGARSITAEKVLVDDELAARVVKAMSVSSKRLVVTEEALLNHASLLGETVAERLNVTGVLRGRDAILSGTVDVGQLNVTGRMASEIIQAMDAEAKRLVVTEDAILNRATVVQSLVTPELIAERINTRRLGAELVTSGALQTSTRSNRGVKITSDGYKAYDDSGNVAVDLNGRDNLMIGSFATNIDGETGVRIFTRDSISAIDFFSSHAGQNRKGVLHGAHGYTFFSSIGSLGTTSMIIGAQDRIGGLRDDDPRIEFYPFGRYIGFQGTICNGSAIKVGTKESTGAGPGGWITIEERFYPPMAEGASVAVYISPISQNMCECSIGIKYSDRHGFKAIVKNETNRSTGYMWIKYMAVAQVT